MARTKVAAYADDLLIATEETVKMGLLWRYEITVKMGLLWRYEITVTTRRDSYGAMKLNEVGTIMALLNYI